jgi:hypothetical protein
MTEILNFQEFLNESKYTESGNKNLVAKKIATMQNRAKIENPEVEVFGYGGGKDYFDAANERPGQALQRLLSVTTSGLLGLGKGIANLFGKRTELEKYDTKTLRGKKREVLQKWGEDIKKTGKDEKKDYEVFYQKSIDNGKKSFGNTFDITNPKTEQEEIYADYVNSSAKYYKLK